MREELQRVLDALEQVDKALASAEQQLTRRPGEDHTVYEARTITLGAIARLDAIVADLPKGASSMIKSTRWDGVSCILVDKETREVARKGTVVDHRGDEWQLTGGRAPHNPGSSGYVWVEQEYMGGDDVQTIRREFYASVFDLEWAPANHNDVVTEDRLLRARAIMDRAINDLGAEDVLPYITDLLCDNTDWPSQDCKLIGARLVEEYLQ
jgi:hypothetical protein